MKSHHGSVVNALQSTRADSWEKPHSKKYPKKICQKLFLITKLQYTTRYYILTQMGLGFRIQGDELSASFNVWKAHLMLQRLSNRVVILENDGENDHEIEFSFKSSCLWASSHPLIPSLSEVCKVMNDFFLI